MQEMDHIEYSTRLPKRRITIRICFWIWYMCNITLWYVCFVISFYNIILYTHGCQEKNHPKLCPLGYPKLFFQGEHLDPLEPLREPCPSAWWWPRCCVPLPGIVHQSSRLSWTSLVTVGAEVSGQKFPKFPRNRFTKTKAVTKNFRGWGFCRRCCSMNCHVDMC